jgi:hypothetical protein
MAEGWLGDTGVGSCFGIPDRDAGKILAVQYFIPTSLGDGCAA